MSMTHVNSTKTQESIVSLTGALNTRDLGHLKTQDGLFVKPALLYRSSELSYLTPEDVHKLDELTIRTVVDFRALEEAQKAPDKLPPNTQIIHCPIIGNHLEEEKVRAYVRENGLPASMEDPQAVDHYGPFHRMLYLVNSYKDPAYVETVKQYRSFFEQLLHQPDRTPLLYHCTGGRDRTGLATALLLYILGVPLPTIKEDYLASNRLLQPESDNPNSRAFEKFRFSNVYIQPVENLEFIRVATKFGTTPERIYNTLKLKPAYIDQLFGNVMKQYGTMENFFEIEYGLGYKEVQLLKGKYLVGPK